jgi:hypothetical protein
MSSVQSYIKQQNIIYGAPSSPVSLFTFDQDSATVPAVGTFNTVSVTSAGSIFRDMGEVIVSDARTFRRVQMITNSDATYGVMGAPANLYQTYWAEMSMINGQGPISSLFQIRG